MDSPVQTPHGRKRFRFGVFDFDQDTLELSKSGRPVSVRPQPLKLLALLLNQPGDLISRDSLQRALWDGETFVDFDQGVNHAVRELRAALGDSADSPRFIQTVHRRGYRFIAPVEPEVSGTDSVAVGVDQPAAERSFGATWRFAAILVAAFVVLSGAYVAWSRHAETPPSQASLVVHAFASPADPALGVGIANAISARLGGQQTLAVRANSPRENDEAWRQRSTHVLDGDITISGTHVVTQVHLRDVSGATIWSDRIPVRADELFRVEDVIAERVVAALRLRLVAAEQDRLKRRYVSNIAAYRDYLRGRAALVAYTPQKTLEAIQAFESALRQDPGYVLARAGLAMAYADMCLRFSPAADVERWGARAEAEARAVLDLDGDLAEAHLARAAVARKREFDWNATVAASRRALALNPNLDQARFFMAAAYYHNGYMEEALIEMEKGRSLQGTDVIEPIRINALVALFSGNFAPARARLEEVSRLSSQPIGDTYLALAYYYSGSADRSRTMLQSLAESRSATTAARAGAALAGVLAAQGARDPARLHIERVLKLGYRDHHVAYSLGAAYAQLGDMTAADKWLRTAADTGFPCLPFFERDPLLAPIRGRPAFSDLLGYVRVRRDVSLSGH